MLVKGFYSFMLLLGLLVASKQYTDRSFGDAFESKNKLRKSFFKHSFVGFIDLEKNLLNLKSEKFVDDPTSSTILIDKPEGESGIQNKFNFSANSGVIYRGKQTMLLESDALLFGEDSITRAEKMTLNYQRNYLQGTGNIKSSFKKEDETVVVKSQKFEVDDNQLTKLKYQGNVSGKIERNSAPGDFLIFKSDSLIYDQDNKTIFLDGRAYIKRALSEIRALKGKIWLNNFSPGVKYFTMNDDVRVTDEFSNSSGKKIKRYSYSEIVEGFSKDKRLVLSGFPQVKQEGDVIKGNKMIVREDEEVIEIINTNSQFNLDGGE